ncbi:hypothetical protein KIK06_29145 [Nocardiopsis sp. EMB25]|uniref:hypothetical protein n=1 Tax=Nocardiopsis sp. EMB25 TaxID=2835867 RepID=UPI002284D8BC|nr:hypothetical protein [Nocardiopsis sp. EMB25]MCY9787951.1 hypothetical protein [Nocardiopsis sp. EMB25]
MIYRDGTTSTGPQCGRCANPATWQLSWRQRGRQPLDAYTCGVHLAGLAPRDTDALLTPITPQRAHPHERHP